MAEARDRAEPRRGRHGGRRNLAHEIDQGLEPGLQAADREGPARRSGAERAQERDPEPSQ